VNGKAELMEVIGQHNPGDVVAVAVVRDGKQLDVPVTLFSDEVKQAVIKDNKVMVHGATFEALTAAEKSKMNIGYGFRITRLDNGKLKSAGIREGFILLQIDRKPVMNAQDLKDALTNREGGVLLEGVYPNGLRAYYGIGL